MKHYHFTTVVHDQLKRSKDVLLDKSDEYATSRDRLHNFRVAASLQGCSNKEALGGMLAKHTVSIFDMIRDDEDVSIEVWDEKITDHINYLLLLRALVEEEKMDATKASVNYQDKPAVPPMEDYQTHNQYALSIHNYIPKEERDVGKQESHRILEERDRETTGRATETTEQD